MWKSIKNNIKNRDINSRGVERGLIFVNERAHHQQQQQQNNVTIEVTIDFRWNNKEENNKKMKL